MDYLIRFSTQHESFRLAEIEALTQLLKASLTKHHGHAGGILKVDVNVLDYLPTSPFCIVRFTITSNTTKPGSISPSTALINSTVCSYISNSVQPRAIYELWGIGTTYEALHADIRDRSKHLWSQYKENVRFKFSVDTFMGKRSASEQRDIINQFSYLGFKGKVAMKSPDQEWCVMEDWEPPANLIHALANGADTQVNGEAVVSRKLNRIFLGRKIGSSRRHLVDKHDLKKRPYISTTSMDAELALVTANLALAAPGKLFLDPFCGTGGFMVAAAELGAVVLGSDIDGRSFRGKGEGLGKGVIRNMKLYGIDNLFGDCLTSDLTNTPFRLSRARWLDGVIADIPYGVREGLKVLGRRQEPAEESGNPRQPFLIDGVPAFTLPGYIAPKKPYSFSRMLDDILDFAVRTLVNGGRLAFWMPTANEDEDGQEEATVIPGHLLLELKHECVQKFNKWSRRLLVYERSAGEVDDLVIVNGVEKLAVNGTRADELNPFRRRYFQAFAESSSG